MNEIKTHDTMSPESQRIAIAEACGWVMRKNESDWLAPDGRVYQNWGGFTSYPNYPNDLNACREFEVVLSQMPDIHVGGVGVCSAIDIYEDNLLGICDHPICAPAAQRCEAFLKTIGKWKND